MKESNEVLAKFMGFTKGPDYWAPPIELSYLAESMANPLDLKFHKSWDWLMPVVEKIEGLSRTVTIFGNVKAGHVTLIQPNIIRGIGATKIESVYKAVVEFIKTVQR